MSTVNEHGTQHDSRFTPLILIRDLTTLDDYTACTELQEATWGSGFLERVPTAILRVSQMIGGVSAGAFDEDNRLVGFVFGLTGIRDRELVHWSDMLAVREELRSQGIGERLKQYQRDKVMALGVNAMLWTFDPLQAGNAHFNINRLGALPVEYVPDMYGSNTGSALHGALPTDRFIVRWELDAPLARKDTPLYENIPLASADAIPDVGRVSVQIPEDFGAVRAASDDDALRWRLQIREVVTALLARGFRVTAFHRPAAGSAPFYVFERRR